MAVLTWDDTGKRFYETGVDHCVLYPYSASNGYKPGVAWNGISSISESPSGAESNKIYADNIKYLSLRSAEEFGASIEAYYYPDEFATLDGSAEITDGVMIGQQKRSTFGLSYRTIIGNDVDENEHGYKLHLVYGCTASPSEKSYSTVNDSPEAISFSWEIETVPVAVTGVVDEGGNPYKPVSVIVIDSTKANPTNLAKLETALYGGTGVDADPYLPLPGKVYEIMTSQQ